MSDDGTTAETLGKFYNELISAGIPEMTAAEITRDAAHGLVRGEASLTVGDV